VVPTLGERLAPLLSLLDGRDLINAALVTAAFERGRQPELENLLGQPVSDDAAAHREDVRVVVLARKPRRVEIVAQRGADAGDLVRGHLLALSAAAEHDPALRAPFRDGASDGEADRRVVGRRVAVRPVIVDGVAESRERLFEVFLEGEARVIGADRDSHVPGFYYTL
jgi:hypothetical protein